MPYQLPKDRDRTTVLDFSAAGPLTTRRLLLAIEQAAKVLEAQGHVVRISKKARRDKRVS